MKVAAILFAFMLIASRPHFAADAMELPAPPARIPDAWIHFDTPLWDIAHEGLPFRLTLALPSLRDPVTRALQAAEARWTFSVGYARVYNSYDSTTGIFKNPGGHAAFVSAGRQLRWRLPEFAGAFTPQFAMEIGAHVATRRFPADGTCFNGKVITGLEWIFRDNQLDEWSVGVMWQHFSNATIFSRNAGYDALALRFGRRL